MNKMNKKGISNQALVALVIAAVIVSIAGTWISLSKLKTIEITGLATEQTGTINVTAAAAADISLPTNSVNFSTLSNGQVNDTSTAAFTGPAPFNISNDGNVCVNITVRRTQTGWLSGTVTGGNTSNNNGTLFNVTCYGNWTASSAGCRVGTQNGTGPLGSGGWTNLTNGSAILAIGGLNYSSGNDTAEVEIRIHVPSDEAAGSKQTTVTFTASNSGLC